MQEYYSLFSIKYRMTIKIRYSELKHTDDTNIEEKQKFERRNEWMSTFKKEDTVKHYGTTRKVEQENILS